MVLAWTGARVERTTTNVWLATGSTSAQHKRGKTLNLTAKSFIYLFIFNEINRQSHV